MCIVLTCYPVCGIMNFVIDLSFLIKPFLYIDKKSGQKIKYLENEKSLQGEIKSLFHHFERAFSCHKWLST